MHRIHLAFFVVFSILLLSVPSSSEAGVLLATPTNLTAAAVSSNQVELAWSDTNALETGFVIQRSFYPFIKFKKIGTTTADVTRFRDLKALPSKTYYYRVRAVGPQKSKSAYTVAAAATTPPPDSLPPSVSFMAPPAGTTITAPQDVLVEAAASDDVGIARVDFYDGATLKSSLSSAPYAYSWSVTSADNGTHALSAKAFDAAGNSMQSPYAGITVSILVLDTTAPTVPGSVAASVASCSQVNVSWAASTDTGGSGLAGYKVYRNGTQVGTSATTSYASTGLVASTSYSFTVAAYDNAGNTSAQSAASSATTSACANQLPVANAGSDQTVTVGTQVTLSGSASSDSDGSIVSYSWDFGDSTTGTGVSVTHTYNVAGTYWVTLTVTDNVGGRGTDQAYVDARPAAGAGQFDWVQRYGGTGGDLGYKVAVAVNGDMLLAGSFQSAVSFGGTQLTSAGSDDVFVARYSDNGTHQWSRRFGGTGTDSASDIALDSNGDLVVCGYFSGTVDFGGGPRTSAGAYDIFVAKFAPNGTHLWSKTLGAADNDMANSVAVDTGGNVIVTGVFRWTVDFGLGGLTSAMFGAPDMFLAKYAADGTPVWTRNFSGPSSDFGSSVAADSADNVLLAGGFMGSLNLGGGVMTASGTTSEDFYVAKFTPAGQHVWSRKFGNIGTDTAADLAVDGSNNVVVTGQFALTVDFGGGGKAAIGQDVYVLKLSGASGAHLWSKNFTSSGNETGNSIVTDGANNILLTGYLDGSVDFGGGTMTTAGSADIFVLKLAASNGGHLWSHKYGAASFEQGLGITVDVNDKPLVTGYFKGTVDFGGGPISGTGTAADIFLLELWP